jgi:acetylglutamate kinase
LTIVVRVGGTVLDDSLLRGQFAVAVAELVRRKHNIVVVHGGGTVLGRTLAQLGKFAWDPKARFTDMQTRDVALMVSAGVVNKQLVSAIAREGVRAMGMCGADGAGFTARRRKNKAEDFGFLGEIRSFDRRWVEAVWSLDAVPVLSNIALGPDGEYYKLNTDELAAFCASACKAGTLVLLADTLEPLADGYGIIRCRNGNDLALVSNLLGAAEVELKPYQDALRSGVDEVSVVPLALAGALCDLCDAAVACAATTA